MKKSIKVILSAIFILGLAILLVSCFTQEYRSIKIELMQGTINITDKNNEKSEGYVSRKLKSGDTIETKAESSCVLKLDGDKYIYIGENSNINLVSSEHDSTKTKIRVNEGSIVTEVKNKLSDLESFNVETPNSSMAIRGTTFGVTVKRVSSSEYKIDYKLVEGKIELTVIEKTDSGYNLGIFNMNPMEEINIISRDNAIVSGDTLTDAINKIEKKDSSVVARTYQDVQQYISETENVILYEEDLEVEDVDDILINVPDNHDENEIRVVALLSTFDVYNGVNKIASEQMIYESESQFKIKAKALERLGYDVVKWKVGNTEVQGSDEIELDITSSTIISPIYKEKEYNINVSSSIYGEFVKVNNTPITEEKNLTLSKVQLSFTEVGEVVFDGWYEIDGKLFNQLSTEKNYEFTPTKNMEIVAVCHNKTYNVTVSSDLYNNIKVNGEALTKETTYEYTKGEITLSYEAEDGISFKGWYVDDTLVSNLPTYTFTVTSDIEIECKLEEIVNTASNVTVSASAYQGFVKVDGETLEEETTYSNSGTVMTFEFTEPEDYVFDGWMSIINDREALISSDATFTYTPDSDIKVFAKYHLITYDVIIGAETYGSVKVDGVAITSELIKAYDKGTTIELEYVETAGLKFDGWAQANPKGLGIITTEKTYTLTVLGDIEIRCINSAIPDYNITVSATGYDGYIKVDGETLAESTVVENHGDDIVFEYTKPTGYQLLGWYDVSGETEELLSKEEKFIYTPDGDISIKAKYEKLNLLTVKSDDYTAEVLLVDGDPISEETKIYTKDSIRLGFEDNSSNFIFLGWYKETENGLVLFDGTLDLTVDVTADITIWAKFIDKIADDYVLNAYDSNGVVVPAIQHVAIGSETVIEPSKYTIKDSSGQVEIEVRSTLIDRSVYNNVGTKITDYSLATIAKYYIEYSLKSSAVYPYSVVLYVGDYEEYQFTLTSTNYDLITMNGETLTQPFDNSLQANSEITLKAKPNSRYTFVGWVETLGKGQKITLSTDTTYTFNLNRSMVVCAEFKDNYNVTLVPANVNGIISTYTLSYQSNISDEVELYAGMIVTLNTPVEESDTVFMGWYETLRDGSTSLYSANSSVSNYNIEERVEAGVVSIQARYVTDRSITSMNVYLEDTKANETYDAIHHIQIGTGEKVDTSGYRIHIVDGKFDYYIPKDKLTIEFKTGDYNGVDPENTSLDDGTYYLYITDLNMNTITYLETQLEIEPVTLTVRGSQSGATVATNSVNDVSVGAYGSQTFEAVSSFTATVDTSGTDSTYLYLGWYEDTGVDSDPYKLLTTDKTLTMAIKKKTTVLPLFIKPYVDYGEEGSFLNYGKYGSELGVIEVPLGSTIYDVYDFDNQQYTVQQDLINSTKYFELDESKVDSQIDYSGQSKFDLKDERQSVINYFKNARVGQETTLYFYVARGNFSGSYRAATLRRTVRVVLPEGVSVRPTYEDALTVNDVSLNSIYTFTEGELTLVADEIHRETTPYTVNAIFAGWYITYINSSNNKVMTELYSEDETITISVEDFMATANCLIEPIYVQLSDYNTNQYVYSVHDLEVAVDEDNNSFLLLPGEKFTADSYVYYVEDYLYNNVYDDSNNMVTGKVKAPASAVKAYIWDDDLDEYKDMPDEVLPNGDYYARVELFDHYNHDFKIHVGGIVATLSVPYDCTVIYSQGGARTEVNDVDINFADNFVIESLTCTTQGVKFLGWYEIAGGKAKLLTTNSTLNYEVTRMCTVAPIYITTENNYTLNVYDENGHMFDGSSDKMKFIIGDSFDITKLSFEVVNNSIAYPVSRDLINYKFYDNSDEYAAESTEAVIMNTIYDYNYIRFNIADCYASENVYLGVYGKSNVSIINLNHIEVNFYSTYVLNDDMTTTNIYPEVENGSVIIPNLSREVQFYYQANSIDSGYSLIGWYFINADGTTTQVTDIYNSGSTTYVTIHATTEDYVVTPIFAEYNDTTPLSVKTVSGGNIGIINAVQGNVPNLDKYVVSYTNGSTTYYVSPNNYTITGYVYGSGNTYEEVDDIEDLFANVSDTTNKPYIKYTISGTGIESDPIDISVIALNNTMNPFSISILDSTGNLSTDSALNANKVTFTPSSSDFTASYFLDTIETATGDAVSSQSNGPYYVNMKIDKEFAPNVFDGYKVRLSIDMPTGVEENSLYEYQLVMQKQKRVGSSNYEYETIIITDPSDFEYYYSDEVFLFLVPNYVDISGIPSSKSITEYFTYSATNKYRYISISIQLNYDEHLFTINSDSSPNTTEVYVEPKVGIDGTLSTSYIDAEVYVNGLSSSNVSVSSTRHYDQYEDKYVELDITSKISTALLFSGITSYGDHNYSAYIYDDATGEYIELDTSSGSYNIANYDTFYVIDKNSVTAENIATGNFYTDNMLDVFKVSFRYNG